MSEDKMCGQCCYECKQPSNHALIGRGKCDDCGRESEIYIFTDETRIMEETYSREPSNLELLIHTDGAEQLAEKALRDDTPNDR